MPRRRETGAIERRINTVKRVDLEKKERTLLYAGQRNDIGLALIERLYRSNAAAASCVIL